MQAYNPVIKPVLFCVVYLEQKEKQINKNYRQLSITSTFSAE